MEAARVLQTGETVIAMAGNPNSGKSSIFNNLTGARQHVGNYAGVTVEKKEGKLIHQGKAYKVVDLPGTYSLGAYSEDERVARDFILKEKPDVIINVVDASNIERNLYLTVQLLEMGANVVVALNMMDEAKEKAIHIDVAKISKLLGVPVVPTVATKKQGMKELVVRAIQAANEPKREALKINYGSDLEKELKKLEDIISSHSQLSQEYPSRYLAIKLLEEDQEVYQQVKAIPGTAELLEQSEESAAFLLDETGEDAESLIADRRYGFISGVSKQAVRKRISAEQRLSFSDKIDKVVTHRVLGIPIFLAAMWLVFQFTFALGDPMIGWVEGFFEILGGVVGGWLAAAGASDLITSFIVDGIIGGVGSVMVFIPNIVLLFFAIALLENSGYMARAAYVMDRFMNTLGLHGKSFIPLLVGFGCNVPGIMAARTLENKKDRIITILITPLMSCAARLPVYVLFVSAFFSQYEGLIIFSLYLLGIVMAVIMGVIFKRLLFPGEVSPFVLELPPYRIPTLKATMIHMWERAGIFVKKAGTIIFSVVVLIWALSVLPWGVEPGSKESALGQIGSFFAPLFAPAGFGSWEASTALIFGILAKEVVVGTLGVIYGVGEEGVVTAIHQLWTPLSAYAFMVMTLLYTPCAAVIGTIKRETGSWKWTVFTMVYTLVLGWVMAVLVYQVGRLFGLS
ncbi:ferrous iron transport protein B [Desulfohalotomaculum tongense]|uniref:ferrous iron transport protein B n=1 Tax=Desulforadius tongensis TaxID=1216062 RepID=UPI0019573C78|nr:ferrous iron transport protein B [Desulforadius tongensis]MBM7854899.1 ferrous iron transport protein B [Desulforadius tongensis]